MTTFETPGLLTFTISIIVFFIGRGLNSLIGPLRRWNIPEAVTGGLLAALVTLFAYEALGFKIVFDLDVRDMLLLYFFTGIGLNAKLGDLISGGRPLAVLLALTLVYLVIQNLIAAGGSEVFDMPKGITVLLGSASLIGGHGTTIAWAPLITARFGLQNALEIGVAAATLGLVIASLIGGPIARILIARHKLSGPMDAPPVMGLPDDTAGDDINHIQLLKTILVLNVAILIGFSLHEALVQAGLKLPLFVACLLCAIALTNTVPRLFPQMGWPSHACARACFRSLAECFSIHVFDEHAALDPRWPRAVLGRGACNSDHRRRPLHGIRRFSSDGRDLRRRRHHGRVRRNQSRRNADRDC